MNPEEHKRKVSLARRRAEEHTSFEGSCVRLPDGVGFFKLTTGRHLVDIIPYVVKRGKEFPGGNPMAATGELYYERTYWSWPNIGVDDKPYVCLSKTFGKPDPIAEHIQREARRSKDGDDEGRKPKERQLFLIYDRTL